MNLSSPLELLETISMEEMDEVSFLRRKDTKYVLPVSMIPSILERIADSYRVLKIANLKTQHYETRYYDTPGLEMYKRHHSGILNRYKIRTRKYKDTHATFLEVKFKNNRRETIKKRIPVPETSTSSTANSQSLMIDENRFIESNTPYTFTDIALSLQNSFERTTLVHKDLRERITIDTKITFKSENGNNPVTLEDLAIIEIKRDRDTQASEMTKTLKSMRIYRAGFSKYCTGIVLQKKGVKLNRFRRSLRRYSKFEPVFREI